MQPLFRSQGQGSGTTCHWDPSLWVSGARSSFLSMSTTCRPVKETLERSLFEAQQRVSQLEITRSQLEMRLHIVTQAKDVIQGDAPCDLFLVIPCLDKMV